MWEQLTSAMVATPDSLGSLDMGSLDSRGIRTTRYDTTISLGCAPKCNSD